MSADEFAEAIKVDTKSVTRWLTGQATPYPRHRATIARALDLTQHDLWPELHQPSPGPGPAVGVVNEVIGSWATPAATGIPNLAQLVLESDGDIDVFEGNRDFKPTVELIDALITTANSGRQVRFMTRAATMLLAPLIGQPNIQLALWNEHDYDMREDYLRAGHTILRGVRLHRFDDNLVVLLIKRQGDGGLYDRIAEQFEHYWAQIVEHPISNQEHQHIPDLDTLKALAWDEDELDQIRTEDDSLDHEPEPAHEPDQSTESEAGQPEPPAGTQPTDQPRRWPGRTE